MSLKVTGNTPGATTREFNTAYEASGAIFTLAVAGGCQVEDTLSGRVFEVTHIADRYPRVPATAGMERVVGTATVEAPQPVDEPTQEVRAA